jgi:hypothetical protein
MAMTVNVGYSEKLGQPDYGSIGASCHIECELDGRLALDSPDAFQNKVRDLYAACVGAVQDELARRNAKKREPAAAATNGSRKAAAGNGACNAKTASESHRGANHQASPRQTDYLERLAREIPALGARRLESLAQRICGKPLAALSSFDASSLIDTLKAIKAGKVDLDGALSGAEL